MTNKQNHVLATLWPQVYPEYRIVQSSNRNPPSTSTLHKQWTCLFTKAGRDFGVLKLLVHDWCKSSHHTVQREGSATMSARKPARISSLLTSLSFQQSFPQNAKFLFIMSGTRCTKEVDDELRRAVGLYQQQHSTTRRRAGKRFNKDPSFPS